MNTKLVIFSVLLFAASCSKELVQLSQSDADRASVKFPGTTLAELQQGKDLYEGTCNKCHGLKEPSSRNEKQWNHIVPIMAHKAKIDDQKEALILKYLVTMGKSN